MSALVVGRIITVTGVPVANTSLRFSAWNPMSVVSGLAFTDIDVVQLPEYGDTLQVNAGTIVEAVAGASDTIAVPPTGGDNGLWGIDDPQTPVLGYVSLAVARSNLFFGFDTDNVVAQGNGQPIWLAPDCKALATPTGIRLLSLTSLDAPEVVFTGSNWHAVSQTVGPRQVIVSNPIFVNTDSNGEFELELAKAKFELTVGLNSEKFPIDVNTLSGTLNLNDIIV